MKKHKKKNKQDQQTAPVQQAPVPAAQSLSDDNGEIMQLDLDAVMQRTDGETAQSSEEPITTPTPEEPMKSAPIRVNLTPDLPVSPAQPTPDELPVLDVFAAQQDSEAPIERAAPTPDELPLDELAAEQEPEAPTKEATPTAEENPPADAVPVLAPAPAPAIEVLSLPEKQPEEKPQLNVFPGDDKYSTSRYLTLPQFDSPELHIALPEELSLPTGKRMMDLKMPELKLEPDDGTRQLRMASQEASSKSTESAAPLTMEISEQAAPAAAKKEESNAALTLELTEETAPPEEPPAQRSIPAEPARSEAPDTTPDTDLLAAVDAFLAYSPFADVTPIRVGKVETPTLPPEEPDEEPALPAPQAEAADPAQPLSLQMELPEAAPAPAPALVAAEDTTRSTQPQAEAAPDEDPEFDLFGSIERILSHSMFTEAAVARTPAPIAEPEELLPEASAEEPIIEEAPFDEPSEPEPETPAAAEPEEASPAEEAPELPWQMPEESPAEEQMVLPWETEEEAFPAAEEPVLPNTEAAAAKTSVAAAQEEAPADEPPAEEAPMEEPAEQIPPTEEPAEEIPPAEEPRPMTLLEQLMAIATPVELGKGRPAPVPELDDLPPTAPQAAASDLPELDLLEVVQPKPSTTPTPATPTPAEPTKREKQAPAHRKAGPAVKTSPVLSSEAATATEAATILAGQTAQAVRKAARKTAAQQTEPQPRTVPAAPQKRERPAAEPEPVVLDPAEAYKKYCRAYGSLGSRFVIVVILTVLSLFFTVYAGLGWRFLPELFNGGLTAYLLLVLMLASILVSTNVWKDALAGLRERKFRLDALLLLAALLTALDVFPAAHAARVPFCAVVQLLLCFSLWGKYNSYIAKITSMRVLREVQKPIGIVEVQDVMKGHRGILRAAGNIEQFMKRFEKTPQLDRVMALYAPVAAVLSLVLALVISLTAKTEFLWTASLLLLAGLPLAGFVGYSRAFNRLSKRLDESDAVLCGWHGAALFGGKHTILISDADIFPRGSLTLNGFKVLKGNPDRVIGYAEATIRASECALSPLFENLLEQQNARHYNADQFRFYDNGGFGATVNGEEILVGSGDFMRRMGVHMEAGMRVQQAVYVSVGGELAGVFAVRYTAPESVYRGLSAICRNRHFKTTLITRCFLGTPAFLEAKFNIPTNNISYPGTKERLRLSETEHHGGSEQGAILAEDSFGAFAEAAAGGRQLHGCSWAALILALVSGLISFVLMAVLAALGAQDTANTLNLLLYFVIWAVPTLLLTGWADKY